MTLQSSPTEVRLSVTRPPEDDVPVDMDMYGMVSCKMDEFFQDWLSTPQAAKLVKRLVALANNDAATLAALASSPHNTPVSGTAIPATTRSPSAGLGLSPSHSPGGANGSWEEELLGAPPPYFTLKDASPPASAVITPKSPGRRTSDADQSPVVEKQQKVTSPSNRSSPKGGAASGQLTVASSESGATPKKAMMTSIEGVSGIQQKLWKEWYGPIDPMDEDCFSIWQTFCSEQLCVSMYFADPILRRIRSFNGADESAAVTKDMFVKYWRGIGLELGKAYENFFNIVRKDTCEFIVKNDFREFVWVLLDTHPGLEFLQDTPEFQDRYTDTVLCRIFYCCDSRQLGRITLRDLNRSRPSLVDTWLELDQCEDINKIRAYFSYEHFYVLYCKFWELDEDHDFLLDKDDLLKYDGHAFSRKAIDRIFSEIPAKFISGIPGKMGYEDFCWFLISDEDKTTDTSLEYFFKLVDLDGDGVIRDHEMAYFYLEQVQRLECLHQEAVQFQDILCQMNDLIMPEQEGQFELEDFKRTRKISGIFFSILLSLNKFLAYEQRDPFSIKQEQLEHPDYSDWDRFCAQEYIRLAMEDDADDQASNSVMNPDGGDMDGQQRLRNADGLDLGRG
ncbi:Serine/threonine-protein phosphatase 2A regulatory subunit B'' subunit alpha [Perkinsus olseni]|uniref:Serine/threonine-protein phosphatase 2A regulatory subunit B'' subunit alpha n=1 Tax=Perkinsus olseni TaxID=32597 RepID=A0A7J6L226_PEROL|nr:Serine/threonine-protein phosphatase 2A regulatory subunit B'' subunit alpha [Perkinsus olseni]